MHMWPNSKNTQLLHTQYQTYKMDCWFNTLSYSTVWFVFFVFVFFYQTLCKSRVVLWLHWLVMVLLYWCSEGWVSHEGLVNVFIFSLKGCEHKEGPVEPKIGPLAFNHLRIPFYPPILSSPSTPHPPPLYITNMSNITLTKNLRKTAWILGVWKLFTHTIIGKWIDNYLL